MNERQEYHRLAAYWEVVAEDAIGWRQELAIIYHQYYLRRLGMLAVEGDDGTPAE